MKKTLKNLLGSAVVIMTSVVLFSFVAPQDQKAGAAWVVPAKYKSMANPQKGKGDPDNVGKMLDMFLNSISGNASPTYSTLRADPSNWIPWSPYGNITLNGSMISESDLQALLNDLSTQQDVKLELSVENQ